MNRSVTKIAFIPVICLLASFACLNAVHAQHIKAILYHADRAEDLKRYYRDRLLQISYKVRKKAADAKEFTVYGTGFVVSPDGWAFTAAHVFKEAFSEEYEQVEKAVVSQSNDGQMEPLLIAPKEFYFSKTGDIAFFRITTPSGAPLSRYFCVDRSGRIPAAGSKVTVAAWRYYRPKDEAESWYPQYKPSKDIEQVGGPGSLFEYIGFSEAFENSMSGGVVAQDGRVIAVVSTSLMDGTTATADGNYAYPIRAADVPWKDRATDCGRAIEGEEDFVRNKDYKTFFEKTCEGDLAWIPPGATKEFFAFPVDATYRINRRHLTCEPSVCDRCEGPKPEKTVRFVVNHVSLGPKKACSTQPIAQGFLGMETYYGTQVIPFFEKEGLKHIVPRAEFYRNTKLARRNTRGQFDSNTKGSAKRWDEALIGPTALNDIIEKSAAAPATNCRNINSDKCSEIAGLQYFDRETDTRTQWHGYPRTQMDPKSTLAGRRERRLWTLPPQLLDKQGLRVKNWILRFTTTTEPASDRPVDFAFCVNSDWDSFVVRAFAPERGSRSVQMEVILDD